MPSSGSRSPARSVGSLPAPPRRSLRRRTSLSESLARRLSTSLLSDNTDIDFPRRKSWWKNLDRNSINIKEIFGEKSSNDENLNIENMVAFEQGPSSSQEKRRNIHLDDMDTSHSTKTTDVSIAIKDKKSLFTRKQPKPIAPFVISMMSESEEESIHVQKKLKTLHKNQKETNEKKTEENLNVKPARTSPTASSKSDKSSKSTRSDKTAEKVPNAEKEIVQEAKKSSTDSNKNRSSDRIRSKNADNTTAKTLEGSIEINTRRKPIFGNKPIKTAEFPIMKNDTQKTLTNAANFTSKTIDVSIEANVEKKTLFANKGLKQKGFPVSIMSESDEESIHVVKKLGALKRDAPKEKSRRASNASRSSKRSHSPDNLISETMQLENWKMLPSSTMIVSTPAKKLRKEEEETIAEQSDNEDNNKSEQESEEQVSEVEQEKEQEASEGEQQNEQEASEVEQQSEQQASEDEQESEQQPSEVEQESQEEDEDEIEAENETEQQASENEQDSHVEQENDDQENEEVQVNETEDNEVEPESEVEQDDNGQEDNEIEDSETEQRNETRQDYENDPESGNEGDNSDESENEQVNETEQQSNNESTKVKNRESMKEHGRPSEFEMLRDATDQSAYISKEIRSSTEGSEWNSHRTQYIQRKSSMLPKKSLRAMIMEKSHQMQVNQVDDYNDADDHMNVEEHEFKRPSLPIRVSVASKSPVKSPGDSPRTAQSKLNKYFKKITNENFEKKQKIEEKIKGSIKKPESDPNFERTFFESATSKNNKTKKDTTNKPKPLKQNVNQLNVMLDGKVYKPPKLYKPPRATWITTNLYKYLDSKLRARYGNETRNQTERLVQLLFEINKHCLKKNTDVRLSMQTLQRKMALMGVVETYFQFYTFINNFMPKDFRVKTIPDIANGLVLNDLWANIIPQQRAKT